MTRQIFLNESCCKINVLLFWLLLFCFFDSRQMRLSIDYNWEIPAVPLQSTIILEALSILLIVSNSEPKVFSHAMKTKDDLHWSPINHNPISGVETTFNGIKQGLRLTVACVVYWFRIVFIVFTQRVCDMAQDQSRDMTIEN